MGFGSDVVGSGGFRVEVFLVQVDLRIDENFCIVFGSGCGLTLSRI